MKRVAVILLLTAALAQAGIGTGSVQTCATGTTYVTLGRGQGGRGLHYQQYRDCTRSADRRAGVAIPIADGSGISAFPRRAVSRNSPFGALTLGRPKSLSTIGGKSNENFPRSLF